LRAVLEPLCRAGIDVLQTGFAYFAADIECPAFGDCQLSVDVACTGVAAPADAIDAVLADLQLRESDEPTGGSRAASGVCAALHGALSFVGVRNEGSLFSLQLALPGAVAHDGGAADADGARAWLISDNPVTCRSLERGLQRFGWATRAFLGIDAASARLDQAPDPSAGPALVVAYEGASVTASSLSQLRGRMAASTQVVLAATWGSASLDTAPQPDIEVRAWPFSPRELLLFTRRLDAQSPAATGETRPAALTFASRPRALAVDDNGLNRLVATGLLQLLGYEVEVACDGAEAVDCCMRRPPDVVLMDVQMPRMDGIEATRRLRWLQAQGALPPFAIVAATAGGTHLCERDCLDAGMDSYLLKPLTVDALAAALHRASRRCVTSSGAT
jgi:CheY-like chemotaxis protein